MSGGDEDDKPTVVLDLNALKKKKQQQEDDLANMVSGLEFNVKTEPAPADATDSEELAEDFLNNREQNAKPNYPVILFDFQSDLFAKSISLLPKGYNYKVVSTLPELNQCLKYKEFQIVVFNFDANPKAINQLSAQIKQKMPYTKVLIMAKSISPEKALIHAKTASGASGYYQFPLDAARVEKEFEKIHSKIKKVS